jgi:hypothetical protein
MGRESLFCLLLTFFTGCGEQHTAKSPATTTPSEKWMELRTRFHRYDTIAGNDKFRDFKIQFVALLEYLMYCGPTDKDECDGMEFFFPAFDSAIENVKAGGTRGITYPIFMDSIGAIQIKMNDLVEHLSRDLSAEIDHWRSAGTRLRIDALRGTLLTDVSMYLLLAGREHVIAQRTRLYPVPSEFGRERAYARFNFHGTFHYRIMMLMCRLSDDALKKQQTKCLGLVTRVFHKYYTDRVLRTSNAANIDPPDETDFYGLELSFQHAMESYDESRWEISPEIAPVILKAMKLLAHPTGDNLPILAGVIRALHLFGAGQSTV